MVTVVVPDKNKLEFAIRLFRKKTQKEGIVREARRRQEYEKPCEMRKRKEQESRARTKRKKKMF
ncbi:MAG TPA: 30S ribosomal protein S21 [Rickettsiales bacterium]|nr:30S ribosomal protein S21 [Rickettsiales bacterium]